MQNIAISSGLYKKEEAYWNQKLSEIYDLGNLPFDNIGELSKNVTRKKSNCIFTLEQTIKINQFCKCSKKGVFVFLTASLNVLIHKLSQQKDIIINTPLFLSSGDNVQINNSLILRINVNPENTYKEFLFLTTEEIKESNRNANYPIWKVVEDLNVSSQMLRHVEIKMEGLHDGIKGDSDSDISFSFYFENERLSCEINYNEKLFDEESIYNFGRLIQNIINECLNNPLKKISEIKIISDEEHYKVLNEINKTEKPIVRKSLSKFVEEICENDYNRIVAQSVKQIGEHLEYLNLSYGELNRYSNQIAHCILDKMCSKGDVVGICMSRSLKMISAILGVLKAGCVFVPVNNNYPLKRIEHILNDSGAKTLIIDDTFKDKQFNNELKLPIFNLNSCAIEKYSEKNLNIDISSESDAAIIYTSGSTGKPKGVILSHCGILNHINTKIDLLKFNENDILAHNLNVSFVASIWKIFAPLLTGARLIMYSENINNNPEKLFSQIDKDGVTVVEVVPSLLSSFIELIDDQLLKPELKKLRYLILTGEQVHRSLINNFFKHYEINIINAYGQTECSDDTLHYEITKDNKHEQVLIGKPSHNTRVYILDRNFQQRPIGVAGELFIAGVGVSKGYHNNEILNQQKFISGHYVNEKRLFRTGDLGKWTIDGNVRFLGRVDNLVKIRGFRIELGEIEDAILGIAPVTQVIVQLENSDTLRAFYCSGKIIDEKEIVNELKKVIPEYMIPVEYVKIDEMPLNMNGKIDRNALKSISRNTHKNIILPETPTEKKVYRIWEKILNKSDIGIYDNFFEIGGHSLKATRLLMQINKEFKISLSITDIFTNNSLKKLAKYIDSAEKCDVITVKKASEKEYYELSSNQKRLWILNAFNKENLAYNITGAILIKGEIEISRIEQIFKILIERHDALRTSIIQINGRTVQKIEKQVSFNINHSEKILKVESSNIESEINNAIIQFVRPFNLEEAPLFRVAVLSVGEQKKLLIIDMHHIISDGKSLRILIKEFIDLYNGKKLVPLLFNFKDYSEWENLESDENKIVKQKAYWLKQFCGDLPILNLTTDHPRKKNKKYIGDTIKIKTDETMLKELVHLSIETDTTLYMVLLTAYFVTLYKHTDQNDIIVGSPYIGRTKEEFDNTVGMFVNTLAIRSFPSQTKSFVDYLSEVKKIVLGNIKNQDFQYGKLVDSLKLVRSTGRNPLFDVMFIFQNFDEIDVNIENIEFKQVNVKAKVAKFDLTLEIIQKNNLLFMEFEYDKELFFEKRIENFSKHYINIINQVVRNPNLRISDIEMIGDIEKEKILFQYNNSYASYNQKTTLHEIFQEKCEVYKEKIAIECIEKNNKELIKESITYHELNNRVNQLANYLLEIGMLPGNRIAIETTRNIQMAINVLAVFKIACVYVPVDMNYPDERIEYILKDCEAKCIVRTDQKNEKLYSKGIKNVFVNKINFNNYNNSNVKIDSLPERHAAIIYTSGSTGKPKGVILNHRGIINHILTKIKLLGLCENDVLGHNLSFNFVASIWKLFASFFSGGKLIIYTDNFISNPGELFDTVKKEMVTVLEVVPSMLNTFLKVLKEQKPDLQTLKFLILTGEEVYPALVKKFFKNYNTTIINAYGQTECSDDTLHHIIKPGFDSENIPIGRPSDNTRIYILNDYQKIVPIGTVGELYIAGDCVADGYLNQKELTEKKFIKIPGINEKILFKTGDLGKWLEDGTVVFAGRRDRQIKIRGFRIEIGEIEGVFATHPEIKDISVVDKETEDGDKILRAFYSSLTGNKIDGIKTYLESRLPMYMIPVSIIYMNDLPLNNNGKIDRERLRETSVTIQETKKIKQPRTENEKIITRILKEVLGVKTISIDDDFFEIGGNSLTAVQVVSKLQLNYEIEINDIFECRTITAVAAKINRKDNQLKDQFEKIKKFLATEYKLDVIRNNLPFDKYYSKNEKYLSKKLTKRKIYENILITGCTGYLGCYLLHELLYASQAKIFLLIRGEDYQGAQNKIKNKYLFYFNDDLFELFQERIIVIRGDISQCNFGLDEIEYLRICNEVDCIINSAANVKHYGNYNELFDINVKGTNNLIEFALKGNQKDFHHISTVLVGSGIVENKNQIMFTEDELDVKQKITNYYAKTKFEAEKIVYNARKNGINTNIYRIGNVVFNSENGHFQENINENGFYSIVKSFVSLGIMPGVEEGTIDFSFVDYVSKGIIALIDKEELNNEVFHVYNPNLASFNEISCILNQDNYMMKTLPIDEFLDKVYSIMHKNKKREYVENILLHSHILESINETHFVKSCDRTKLVLSMLNVEWPKLNVSHIKKMMSYCKQINYL